MSARERGVEEDCCDCEEDEGDVEQRVGPMYQGCPVEEDAGEEDVADQEEEKCGIEKGVAGRGCGDWAVRGRSVGEPGVDSEGEG